MLKIYLPYRKLPDGIRMDGGSDWVCLYRDFARYIIYENDELVQGLLGFFKYTLLPAEVRENAKMPFMFVLFINIRDLLQ